MVGIQWAFHFEWNWWNKKKIIFVFQFRAWISSIFTYTFYIHRCKNKIGVEPKAKPIFSANSLKITLISSIYLGSRNADASIVSKSKCSLVSVNTLFCLFANLIRGFLIHSLVSFGKISHPSHDISLYNIYAVWKMC